MIVTVIGMHRSGTSMVAKMLHLCGVHLGAEKDLFPATPDNMDGHWEHIGIQEVNDEILRRFGGGWDQPPRLPANWVRDPSLDHARTKAKRLIAELSVRPVWGWKDPRTSLTLPFWRDQIPDLKSIVCVRNPLDVAAVAAPRRQFSSYVFGLDLWKTYSHCIQTTVPPAQRLATHYSSYFSDPRAEIKRVMDWLGLRPSAEALEACRIAVKAELRHHEFTRRQLDEFGVDAAIFDQYQRWCDESGYDDRDHAAPVVAAPAKTASFDVNAVEADVLRRELRQLRRALKQQQVDAHADLRQQLEQARSECSDVRQALDERDAALAETQRQIELFRTELADLRQIRDELTELARERDGMRQQLHARDSVFEDYTSLVRELREELIRQAAKTQALPTAPRTAESSADDGANPSPHRQAYRNTVQRIRDLVREHVPAGSTVAVISKGDDELIKFSSATGSHFPQDEAGAYAGYYPANGGNAVAHLEVLRARGARHLVLPSQYAWWLDSYPEFRDHLANRYQELAREKDAGILWSLTPPAGATETPKRKFAHFVEHFRSAHGRDPAVLDWNCGQPLAALFPDLPVFAPPSSNGHLPYVDHSVDVVAVEGANADALAEACRVAATSVINFRTGAAGEPALEFHWLNELAGRLLPSTSIIIPVFNQWKQTAACLAALRETLPEDFRGEIIVVDDASTDETSEGLARLSVEFKLLRTMRNDTNAGFVDSCHRGTEGATGEFLVFLNNDTVPLAGWLPPLLRTFEIFPNVGAVGGKLLFPDGRLQEAGGIIFRDGSAAHFGRGDANASKSLFNYAREIDYCSGALLATPRALFEELGGFDAAYRPGYYEDTDYCFRLREHGRRVYYQPESQVVHVEGATAGTNHSEGMKRHQEINLLRFRERWQRELAEQPERPVQFDEDAWYMLAQRGRVGTP